MTTSLPQIGLADLAPLLPFLVLCGGGLLLVLIDALVRGRPGFPWAPITALLPIGALVAYAARWDHMTGVTKTFGPMYIEDAFGGAVGVLVCIATLLAVGLSGSYLDKVGRSRGEYYALLTFSASGVVLFVSTTELLSLFLGLELLSIPVYVLSGYLRKDPKSLEAGMKYFLLGAFSSAVFLFGGALIYVASGTTNLVAALQKVPGDPLAQLGFIVLLSGFLFKAATVPFHMWTPDVYQGAPTAVTAFMATAVKAAAFGALARVLFAGTSVGQLIPVSDMLWWIAVLTMTVGNLAALTQSNVKRMLAYSSIAHAGYLLIGLVVYSGTGDPDALSGVLYYLLAYTLMNIGAFGVVIAWGEKGREHLEIPDFAGLGWKSPALGLAMLVFMVSLAGIPPTAGFFGKYFIFRNAVQNGYTGLIIIAVLNSAMSVYYYLRVLVALYMQKPVREINLGRPQVVGLVVAVCAVLVFWVGFAPNSFLPGVPAIVDWVQGAEIVGR
ncbi:MAG: NADH-quinone oxidoreductase subunit N [Candidatus Eisenbacteria bacterium]|uniref:NADH-quinone oxidoreductase subunit N n=1 Tax=Eiseniibacteriota bacterium TaxID=2212470 RepID=A0A956N8U0_UNCEI|nr:NADH-quinone oxidoreductase subunit N [Candidatus Eisenbacteria bacterium]MCB9463173.1 NADH-quinone oxidoreductase subunit N [Candidatus Eisenbacteria bacterium]